MSSSSSSPGWLTEAARHRYTPPVLWGPTGEHIPGIRCPWCHGHTVMRRGWLLYCDKAHRAIGGTCGWSADQPTDVHPDPMELAAGVLRGQVHRPGTLVRRPGGDVWYRVVEVAADPGGNYRMRIIPVTGQRWRKSDTLLNLWVTIDQVTKRLRQLDPLDAAIGRGEVPRIGDRVRRTGSRRSRTTYIVDRHRRVGGVFLVHIVSERAAETKRRDRPFQCWIQAGKVTTITEEGA